MPHCAYAVIRKITISYIVCSVRLCSSPASAMALFQEKAATVWDLG